MLNFRLPYFATNPSEFWQRWHISLSSWLRDYLYIPLGGNRGTSLSTYRNLLLTMLLGGLWHGAAWNFVIWGAYHGFLLIGHRVIQGAMKQNESWLRWSYFAPNFYHVSFDMSGVDDISSGFGVPNRVDASQSRNVRLLHVLC